jgi:hypothetical protein
VHCTFLFSILSPCEAFKIDTLIGLQKRFDISFIFYVCKEVPIFTYFGSKHAIRVWSWPARFGPTREDRVTFIKEKKKEKKKK